MLLFKVKESEYCIGYDNAKLNFEKSNNNGGSNYDEYNRNSLSNLGCFTIILMLANTSTNDIGLGDKRVSFPETYTEGSGLKGSTLISF